MVVDYDAEHRRLTGLAIGLLALGGFFLLVVVFASHAYAFFGNRTQVLAPIIASVFLGVMTPVIIIAIRHQIRLTRIKLINLFAETFELDPYPPQIKSRGKAKNVDGTKYNAAFEFVKGKYYVDLDIESEDELELSRIPKFPMMVHADWMLLVCALPFIALATACVFLITIPVVDIVKIVGNVECQRLGSDCGSMNPWLWPSILTLGGTPSTVLEGKADDLWQYYHTNVLVVAGFSFTGAYFYSLRILLRSVSTFDLSPVTFLRCFTHTVLSILLAVVLYRSLYGIGDRSPVDGVASLWLATAFAIGFLPDAALQYAMQKSPFAFKSRFSELEQHAKIIPLTTLDGIDPYIAFRLEESNIFDVQNLAAFNPIMLHIESPYGIYQCVDWVAQAQLCTVVGPEKFFALKSIQVRTIFDLEREILSSSLPDDTLLNVIGAILVMDCGRDRKLREALQLGAPPGEKEGSSAEIMTRRQSLSVGAVRHLTWLIVDDLHVRRLRQIWQLIQERLGPESDSFSDTSRSAWAVKKACPGSP